MGDARSDFTAQVARLVRAARVDLAIRQSTTGLFFGLLAALGTAVLAGSVALPVPAPLLAAGAAAAGLFAGALVGLLTRTDPMRLLIHADSVMGSRELASTALELAAAEEQGGFGGAVLEDASRLLAGTKPRAILGRLRLPLAPFIGIAALLTAGALFFPVNLGSLFASSSGKDREIARIAEDLREGGEKLAEKSQGQGLDRTIELSRELAQLGSDLLARKITVEDALDRMSELQSGLEKEYQLRTQQLQPAPSAAPGSGDARSGGSSQGSPKEGVARDLADALKKLREAQRDLSGQGRGDRAQADGRGSQGRGEGAQGDQGQAQPGQGEQGRDQQGQRQGQGRAGSGSQSAEGPGDSEGSGIGTLPAPQKRGPATSIVPGDRGPGLQAQGNAGAGDSARMLARALPEWTGSHLPEQTVLNEYSRQAESALARDEVPLRLRQSVKEYFTVIGISK
ncbi:MAG: hypothetical protein ABSG38_15820 [Spirochaetia bacterium]|jgi:hypothetical protein